MKNLLFVENEKTLLKVWSKFFGRKLNVFIAEHVPEALEELRQHNIELAVLDLRLNGPTANGLDVYYHIRNTLKSNIPILFITGLASGVELHAEALQCVEDDTARGLYTKLVMKPINIFDDPDESEQPGILHLIEDMLKFE